MPEPQAIRDAIAEAVGGSQYVQELEEGNDDLGELLDPAADPAAGEGQSDKGDGTEGEEASEDPLDGVTDEELPDTYWGTSLEGLSPEQKRSVIAALEQRDSKIQQLQTALAKQPEPPKVEEPAQDEGPITDEDILGYLEVDLEDSFAVEQAKKLSVPLVRQIMALEETVEKLSETENVRSIGNQWNRELDELEAEFGKLPGDRVQVLNYAAENQIVNPEVLYFRLTAPSRKAVEAEIAKVRQTQAKKAAAGGVRPRSVETGKQSLDTKGLSLRDTVKAAAIQAQQETGKRWKDILAPGE